jgi:hypothetical protein
LEVVIDGSNEVLLVGPVVEGHDVSELNSDIKSVLLGKVVELVLEILSVRHVLLEAEDSPLFEAHWLMNDGSENACVVQRLNSSLGTLIKRINDGRSLEDLSFDLIGLEGDLEIPFFGLFGVGDGLAQALDGCNSFVGALEETLSDISHGSLVFSDLSRDSNHGTEFGWEIDSASLLLDFEKGLIGHFDLGAVCSSEILKHVRFFAGFSLFKGVFLGSHIPSDPTDSVGSLSSIFGHNDGVLELFTDLGFIESLVVSFVDKGKTSLDRDELGDIVNNQIKSSLENPRGCEKTRPGLNDVVKHLCLLGHEEKRTSTDLFQGWVPEGRFDDVVDEGQGNGMIFHFKLVEVLQVEHRNLFDDDGERSIEQWFLGLDWHALVIFKRCGRKKVTTDKHIFQKYLFERGRLLVHNFEFHKSLEGTLSRLLGWGGFHAYSFLLLFRCFEGTGTCGSAFKKIDAVGVDKSFALALDFEIIGNDLDRGLRWCCHSCSLRLLVCSWFLSSFIVAAGSLLSFHVNISYIQLLLEDIKVA